MNNPDVELRDYLKLLIGRVLAIKSTSQELRSSLEWRKGEKLETYRLGSYFLDLAAYSMSRTMLVELAAMLSSTEDRSLVDFLIKAREHAKQLNPTRENRTTKQRETVAVVEFQSIIDDQLEALRQLDPIVNRIKARRGKSIVHFEKRYFDDSKQLYADFPLDNSDIDSVLETIDIVFKSHHSLLLAAGISMNVVSVHTLKTLLKYARAFQRARKDRDLIDKGFRPADFLGD